LFVYIFFSKKKEIELIRFVSSGEKNNPKIWQTGD